MGVLGDGWLANAPAPPTYLVLGDGAFRDIPHADGIGTWKANALTYEVDANGTTTLFDWSVGLHLIQSAAKYSYSLGIASEMNWRTLELVA